MKMSNYRWKICFLLFFATTINYIDRQVLGLLAPFLQNELGWSEAEYGYIVTAFHSAYAIGLLLTGKWMDKVGVKLGLAVAMTIWSFAGMAHALAYNVRTFAMARFGLAFGESANFPASIKTIAEWFPKKERALATGLFNSGSNIGAIIAPIIVPLIALKLS
jgi:MFS transporter, ACS family, aldohexuronate transporter